MTRAATAPELVKFAGEGQWSDVLAIIPVPVTVFAARVNQATIVTDKLSQLTFDGVTTGAYTAILPGMTVMIGSAAGLSDRGIGYARKSAGSDTLYLGLTSEISAQDNDYITVVRDFGLWFKAPRVTDDGDLWINYDGQYAAQMETRQAIIGAGGDRVLELTGATVATTLTLTGCASYVTTASGGAVTNGTTAAPIFTASAAGDYLLTIVGTAANGAVTTTYRWVYVTTAAAPGRNVLVQNSADAQGWTARVTLYETTATIRDLGKIILYARDYYAGTPGSIGSLAGCENVVTAGYIVGRTIEYDVVNGSVSFEVRPAAYFLEQILNPLEVRLTGVSALPASWSECQSLTVDIAIWNILQNYTTALNSLDVVLSADARTAAELIAPVGSVWSQLMTIGDRIGLVPTCNQYGQLVFAIDTPLVPAASRTGIPIVVTLTADDFESIEVDRVQVKPQTAFYATGQLADGSTVAGMGGGRIPRRTGSDSSRDDLLVASQAEIEELAGSFHARENCPYRFSVRNLRGNNRLIEVDNRLGLTLSGSDNLDGLTYSGYMIIRSITRTYDPKTGAWNIDLEADAETSAGIYGPGDVEVISDIDDAGNEATQKFSFPKFGNLSPMRLTFPRLSSTLPPVYQILDATTCLDASPETGPFNLFWDVGFLYGPTGPYIARYLTPCILRAVTATNPSYILFDFFNTGQAFNHLNCYAIDGAGARIATGELSEAAAAEGDLYHFRCDFEPLAAIAVSGFEVELDAGADATSAGFTLFVHDLITVQGQTSSLTDDQVTYEPTLGIDRWFMTIQAADSAGNGAWVMRENLVLPTIPIGSPVPSMFAAITYTVTGDNPPRAGLRVVGASLPDLGPYVVRSTSSFRGTYIAQVFPVPRAADPANYVFDWFSSGVSTGWIMSLDITFFFSSTVPRRSAGVQTGLLYNVCPGASA